jgi:Voltage gated chloride channel
VKSESSVLRDFTVDSRVWLLSGLALIIGIGATFLAVLLLRLIAVATNLFYYHRFSSTSVSPAGSSLGHWMVIVPVMGGLLVGLMARYGSDKIRGHGIPEAIEAILLNRARVDPKIAILKPISAAIAIGSGGPFGAEHIQRLDQPSAGKENCTDEREGSLSRLPESTAFWLRSALSGKLGISFDGSDLFYPSTPVVPASGSLMPQFMISDRRYSLRVSTLPLRPPPRIIFLL